MEAVPVNAENWCVTPSIPKTHNFTWTIENLKLRLENDAQIESSTFPIGNDDNTKWTLILHKNGSLLHLYLKLKTNSPTTAQYKSSILNCKGELTHSTNSEVYKFYRQNDFKYFSDFISIPNLYDKASQLLPHNKLTILCNVTEIVCLSPISGHTNITKAIDDYDCDLSADLSELLDNGEFSDITLLVNETEYRAHKAILAARSTVFAAMFRHELKEKQTNSIVIEDVKPEVLKEMLNFIYSGETPNLKELAKDLLAVAEKYDLKNLKIRCQKEISDQLSIKTAAETLLLADRYSATELKAQTINFIKGHAKKVIGTEDWKIIEAQHSNLANEVFRQCAQQLSELIGESDLKV